MCIEILENRPDELKHVKDILKAAAESQDRIKI